MSSHYTESHDDKKYPHLVGIGLSNETLLCLNQFVMGILLYNQWILFLSPLAFLHKPLQKQILKNRYLHTQIWLGLLPYCNWKYIILQLSVVIRTDSLSAFWWKSKIRIQIVEKQLFQVTPWAKSKNEIKEAIGRPWHLITPPLWCFLHLDLNYCCKK